MLIYIVYLTAAVLFGVGLYTRIQAGRSGESLDRRHEGWPLLIGIRLCGAALLVAVFFADPPPPGPLQWVGAAFFATAAVWLIWMYLSLGRNITDTVVTRRDATFVSHGPYRFVRHPMYIGLLATGLSLAVVLGSSPLALGAVTIFTLLAIRSKTEERFLIERFGAAYVQYMEHTPRFLPKIF